MSLNEHRKQLSAVKRIVIKVGTQVLTKSNGLPDTELMAVLCGQIAELMHSGKEVLLVSSGAIGMGRHVLGLKERPKGLAELQAVAAVGQSELVHLYRAALSKHKINVGQVLLTYDDFDDRKRYLSVRNTIQALIDFKTLPVINENDTTSSNEIRLGDNDELSALVANAVGAELLIMLTTATGVLRFDKDAAGTLISASDEAPESLQKHVQAEKTSLGSGGMGTKLLAAGKVVKSGSYCVIASGRKENVLSAIFSGKDEGTLFIPGDVKLSPYKRWLGFGRRPSGQIILDAGAVTAIVEGNKSLLSGGISRVESEFDQGDAISLLNEAGDEIARGLVNYSSKEVKLIKGKKSSEIKEILGYNTYQAVVHKDNLVVLK